MKQAMNFRLNPHTLNALRALEHLLHLTKTKIVEDAILRYAEEKNCRRSQFFSLAGSLSDEEADDLLRSIQQSKTRKELTETL